MIAEHGHCFHRPTLIAERMEAGEPVLVGRATVELALWERDRPTGRVRLPLACGVRRIEVRRDDRIVPAAKNSG